MEALVGREREIQTLHDLIESVTDHGAALVVRGEAGVGKSALLASTSAEAKDQGMRVLSAIGVQAETQLPFAGLHQLLRPLLSHANKLPGPQHEALDSAFGVSEAKAPNLFLIALATLELLSDAAEQVPLLVIVEDAQWLDVSTVDALAFVARRLEAEPIVLVIAIREGTESVLLRAGLPELRMEGLDGATAGALLDAHTPGLTPSVRERLLEEAAGNPLALLELPAALQAEQLGGTAPLPPWLPLTTRLERIFGERVSQLPAPTRALLLVAALDMGDLTEALAAASILQGDDVSEEALEPAAAAGLAQVDDALIYFRHPLVRSAVCQAAGSARLRAAHAALATVLAEDPDRTVWHRAAAVAGNDESVARDLEAAAIRAKSRGAQAVAVAALERAAALTRDPVRCGDWLLRAVASAETLGRPDIVTRLLRQAETLDLGLRERTWLHWYQEVYTDAVAWSGVERARVFVELAEQAEQAGEVERALHTLELIAFRCFWDTPDPETRRLLLAAAERLPLPLERPALLRVLGYVAPVERGALVLERLSRAADVVNGDHVAESELGALAGAVGDFEQCSRLLATALAGLRAQGAVGELAHALGFQAWTAICLGNWPLAASAADEAAQWAQETRQSLWSEGANLAQAAVAAARGEYARAETLATAAERGILTVGPYTMLSFVQIVRGLLALGQRRHVEAYEQLRRIFDPTDLAYHPQVRFWAATDYLDAAIHSDHVEEAHAVMAEMESLLEQTHSPLLQVNLAFARPLLAEDKDAEALYLASLGEPLANWPFLRARLQLGYGGWLRRHRRMADSRAPLRAAIEVFDALGVTPWAERARQELRASGETSRPRAPELRDQLSPQELQIAQMAAEGLSNREIGERLYLSHRTVGSHLYRMFPKLEITSRSELHAALAGNRA
jgi:DNA-binding CsgD family transcriptional regulator